MFETWELNTPTHTNNAAARLYLNIMLHNERVDVNVDFLKRLIATASSFRSANKLPTSDVKAPSYDDSLQDTACFRHGCKLKV